MCFTFLFSAHTYPSMPCDPSVCLASVCLYLILCSSSSLSHNYYPSFSPHLPHLSDPSMSQEVTKTPPALFSGFPFFPIFLSAIHCLSCCTTEIQFLCVSSSLVLSVSGYYYMYTHFTSKHCYPIPLNSSYSVSLCYFLGRSMCPGAVFQRCQWRWLVHVHVRCVGPTMHTQVIRRANKPWAFPVPKGLGRAFWLICDHFDDWRDRQNEYEYVCNVENLARMPLAF